MDPLDFLESEELLRFFHCNKTVMSLMENPQIFLNQLRDHNLVPEDRYQKVSRMKSKDNMKRALYNILDWFEKERSQHIRIFWTCVFKDIIMSHYPTLQLLRNSLMDGSFHFHSQLPEGVEKEETDEGKRKELSEDEEGEEKKANSVKKKRQRRSKSVCDEEEEQAGPSSQLTSGQRKRSKKICFSSPLKKGEKSNIWTWPIYKIQLPVTCGDQDGILNRDRLAKGEKCIAVNRRWFTPNKFEKFAGKESYKNWKLSIQCMGTPLEKLLQEGHLKSGRFHKGASKKAKKSLFPSDDVVTVSERAEDENEDEECDQEDQVSSSSKESSTDGTEEEEAEEQTEQQPESSQGSSKKVLKVTCEDVVGTLHEKRFASGTRGKSIRTETRWMTPVEFVNVASGQTDVSWKKDIKCEGKPLSVLIEEEVLKIHSLLCSCRLCEPDNEDLEDQKNDDECCICKSKEEGKLVVCDDCPRSFHPKCHLPHVEDATLEDGGKWMCTFCIYRINKECYWEQLEREAAMSRQISQDMMQCQYLLLYLCSADEHQTFATNPNVYLKDYSTVIKTPMWLGEIADKLQRQLYQTVGQFVSDVQLIFTNCASYNRNNAEFIAMGDKLKKFFDEEFKNVFNIHE